MQNRLCFPSRPRRRSGRTRPGPEAVPGLPRTPAGAKIALSRKPRAHSIFMRQPSPQIASTARVACSTAARVPSRRRGRSGAVRAQNGVLAYAPLLFVLLVEAPWPLWTAPTPNRRSRLRAVAVCASRRGAVVTFRLSAPNRRSRLRAVAVCASRRGAVATFQQPPPKPTLSPTSRCRLRFSSRPRARFGTPRRQICAPV